jgi:hypothetical protein
MTDSDARPLSADEVDRRLPTLQLIGDGGLRQQTRHLSRFAPRYFWLRPGSTSGYHNAHERGLWAHTLKLSTVIERIADSYVNRGLLRPEDVDRAHAAAILHDQRKEGPSGGSTQSDHDLQMGTGVREMIGDEVIARAVEAHMGAWYDGPFPQSRLQEVVHVADMIAAAEAIDLAVQEPVPVELSDHLDETDLREGGDE